MANVRKERRGVNQNKKKYPYSEFKRLFDMGYNVKQVKEKTNTSLQNVYKHYNIYKQENIDKEVEELSKDPIIVELKEQNAIVKKISEDLENKKLISREDLESAYMTYKYIKIKTSEEKAKIDMRLYKKIIKNCEEKIGRDLEDNEIDQLKLSYGLIKDRYMNVTDK